MLDTDQHVRSLDQYGMPKYEYPSHIYSGNTAPAETGIISTSAEERKAFFGGGDTDSSESETDEEEDQRDFFSNSEFLGNRNIMEKQKWEQRRENEENKNSFSNSNSLNLKEGSMYIEGGSSYQQRTDTYNDLIQELLCDGNDASRESKQSSLEEDKLQIETVRIKTNEDLRRTKDRFYKGHASADKSKNLVPHYADEILSSFSGSSSSREDTKQFNKPNSIELPSRQAAFGYADNIVPPKSLETTKTIIAAKPKNQKKKRKARVVITTDDEPIKQIEIIRSQPDPIETNQKKSGKNNQQATPKIQPQASVENQNQSTVTNQTSQPSSKNSKAKRKAQERQQTQSVDGKIAVGSSLKQSMNNKTVSQTRTEASDNPVNSWQRMSQRAKGATGSTSQCSEKSSPLKSQKQISKMNVAISSTDISDNNSRQTASSGILSTRGKQGGGTQARGNKMQRSTNVSEDKRLSSTALSQQTSAASGINPFQVPKNTTSQTAQTKQNSKQSQSTGSNSQLRSTVAQKNAAQATKDSNTATADPNNKQTDKAIPKKAQPEPVFKLKNTTTTQDTTGSIWARLEATNVKPKKKQMAQQAANQQQNNAAATSTQTGGLESETFQANQLTAQNSSVSNKAPGVASSKTNTKATKRKNKKKLNATPQMPQFGADQMMNMMPLDGDQFDFDADDLQQVSESIMMNLGQQASQFSGDRSLLAEQLVQILQKSLSEQFGVAQPNNFENYRRDMQHSLPNQRPEETKSAWTSNDGTSSAKKQAQSLSMSTTATEGQILSPRTTQSVKVPQTQSPTKQLPSSSATVDTPKTTTGANSSTSGQEEKKKNPSPQQGEEDEKFHEMVSVQVRQAVRQFEWKLDSVRKEREAVIDIVETIVKDVFEPKRGERQHGPVIPIGVKQYGSQASFLAVDSSDVDLAVTGLKLGGDIETQIREMRKLYFILEDKKSEGFIKRCEIIESASVPLIKLQVNLQVVQEINRNKSVLFSTKEGIEDFEPEPFVQLDESMVILHVDITFDDYNTSVLNNRFMNNNEQHQQHQQQNNMLPLNTNFPGSMLLNQQNSSQDQSYFYLRDNPQCSAGAQPHNGQQQNMSRINSQPYMPNNNIYNNMMNPMMNMNMNMGMNTMNQLQQSQQLMATQSCSLAISSVHKIKELQKKYTDLRNIVLIIKKLLAKHDLHKPYSGGLNSYSIVLLTSTFLEKFGINHCSALSQNLTEFLKFFGNYFDPSTHGLDGTRFFSLSNEQRDRNEHIYIIDLQNSQNNTSRSAFRIHEIKRVFSQAYEQIMLQLNAFKEENSLPARMNINVVSQLINSN